LFSFFGILLPPLKVTRGRLEKSGRILEAPKTPVAVIAKEASEGARSVIVIRREPTHTTAAAPVSLLNPTDGASAALFGEKGFVILGREATPARLLILVGQNQTLATTVLPVIEGRKLFAHLFLPTDFAHRLALPDSAVLDPMKAQPNQRCSAPAERHASSSGHLPDRKPLAEEICDLVQANYLKGRQQYSLVAN